MVRADLKTEVKKLLKDIKDGKLDEAKASLTIVYKKLDKCAARRYIHPNAASRHKARLSARVNALATGKSA
jgi:small subunit ribosomal protein S20